MPRTPGSPLALSARALVERAEATIETLDAQQVQDMLDDPQVLLVDIRDVRELERDGMIPGARHAPRGMLEFWICPESPYYKPDLDDGRKLVLYCGSGWRSALSAATLREMGRDDVAHLGGGFSGWKKAGLPVVDKPQK
ncbi:rhodanese-like domain-containing protein [Luteococcus sp. Sow4_B9]|uniref:rhodanese-like domain-containing protein n=1 Tax=Luteococcus sp. Sow4_B9 TaxID=3438792 RepID=UPI003F987880